MIQYIKIDLDRIAVGQDAAPVAMLLKAGKVYVAEFDAPQDVDRGQPMVAFTYDETEPLETVIKRLTGEVKRDISMSKTGPASRARRALLERLKGSTEEPKPLNWVAQAVVEGLAQGVGMAQEDQKMVKPYRELLQEVLDTLGKEDIYMGDIIHWKIKNFLHPQKTEAAPAEAQ